MIAPRSLFLFSPVTRFSAGLALLTCASILILKPDIDYRSEAQVVSRDDDLFARVAALRANERLNRTAVALNEQTEQSLALMAASLSKRSLVADVSVVASQAEPGPFGANPGTSYRASDAQASMPASTVRRVIDRPRVLDQIVLPASAVVSSGPILNMLTDGVALVATRPAEKSEATSGATGSATPGSQLQPSPQTSLPQAHSPRPPGSQDRLPALIMAPGLSGGSGTFVAPVMEVDGNSFTPSGEAQPADEDSLAVPPRPMRRPLQRGSGEGIAPDTARVKDHAISSMRPALQGIAPPAYARPSPSGVFTSDRPGRDRLPVLPGIR